MVAAVAANIIWKRKKTYPGMVRPPHTSAPTPRMNMLSRLPTSAPDPENANVNPMTQNTKLPINTVLRFFMRMLTVFFDLVNPASMDAKPKCIMKTMLLAISTHRVSR